IIFEEAEWLKNQMTRLGLKVFPSEANYIFFRGPGDLFDSCIRKGILIRNCSNYPGLSRGFFRVAVKQHEDNRKLILALKDILL
ncbi:MAG: threonine-phosphate decarboxylase, partial [Blautia sp.]|nr:threonine-phosphate decarboxylase [Blautia sp.]